ncbi:AsnC family transcriptional regulator [Aureimonas ureilytica]|uniref:AsnC family transcriptional regulator n=1 Tax=Aureimonas ureilytica TaxID=401562 RepID=A0A175R3N7_9HYPH|nr:MULTISPECIES: Lrp/AsnC family transcriptional regulator [Aureimonas]KTQ85824.1 AsnC family transcriptional regulator [Aureimonas ureilytica]
MAKPIDAIDRKIMKALLGDGRLTNQQLSEAVNLSPAPCWQRVKRLERDGYIQGYMALLDQELLGASEIVLLEVTLDRHDDDAVENFGRAMAAMPEVLEVYLTTGEYDYFLKVAVNGTAGYEEFLRKRLFKVRGIRHSRTSFTLRCLKKAYSVPPDAERSGG